MRKVKKKKMDLLMKNKTHVFFEMCHFLMSRQFIFQNIFCLFEWIMDYTAKHLSLDVLKILERINYPQKIREKKKARLELTVDEANDLAAFDELYTLSSEQCINQFPKVPDDLIIYLCGWLLVQDIKKLSRTCKQFWELFTKTTKLDDFLGRFVQEQCKYFEARCFNQLAKAKSCYKDRICFGKIVDYIFDIGHVPNTLYNKSIFLDNAWYHDYSITIGFRRHSKNGGINGIGIKIEDGEIVAGIFNSGDLITGKIFSTEGSVRCGTFKPRLNGPDTTLFNDKKFVDNNGTLTVFVDGNEITYNGTFR